MESVVYNGIELGPMIRTNVYDRSVVAAEDGSSRLFVRHTLDIVAYINPKTVNFILDANGNPVSTAGNPIPAIPAQTDRAIREALSQYRKTLIVKSAGVIVLQSPKPGELTDSNNGPKPKVFAIIKQAGPRTWIAHWACVVDIACENDGADQNPIISHRFMVHHHLDKNFFLTTITQGRARFDTGTLSRIQLVPDDFRSILVPAIRPNFKRENVEITVTSDGTALEYAVLDRQMAISLGADKPITNAEGFYSVAGGDGNMQLGNVVMRLWGNPNSSKLDLLKICMEVVFSKLFAFSGAGKSPQVKAASVTYDLFNRFVEVNFTVVQLPPGKLQSEIIGLPFHPGPLTSESFGTRFVPPGLTIENAIFKDTETLNPAPPGDGNSRGIALFKAIAGLYDDPCHQEQSPSRNVGDATLKPFTLPQGSGVVAGFVVQALPEGAMLYSESQVEAVYTEYKLDVKYVGDEHIIQCPVASKDPNAESNFIRTAAATSCKLVKFTGERIGGDPALPKLETDDDNAVYLGYELIGSANEVMADGVTEINRVSGVYRYGLKRPLRPGDRHSMGALPYLRIDKEDNAVTEEMFIDGLIG